MPNTRTGSSAAALAGIAGLAMLVGVSPEVGAQSSGCPNVQLGQYSSRPAIYSDCAVDRSTGDTAYPTLTTESSGRLLVNYGTSGFSPAPAATPTVVGTLASTIVQDMGSSYAGNCTEVVSPSGGSRADAVDGNTYCGFVTLESGDRVYLKGT